MKEVKHATRERIMTTKKEKGKIGQGTMPTSKGRPGEDYFVKNYAPLPVYMNFFWEDNREESYKKIKAARSS